MSKKITKAQADHYGKTRDSFNEWLQQQGAKNTKLNGSLHGAFVDALLDEALFLKYLECKNSADFVKEAMIRCDFTLSFIDEIDRELEKEEEQAEALESIPTQLMTAQ
jgi:hypothetical protein